MHQKINNLIKKRLPILLGLLLLLTIGITLGIIIFKDPNKQARQDLIQYQEYFALLFEEKDKIYNQTFPLEFKPVYKKGNKIDHYQAQTSRFIAEIPSENYQEPLVFKRNGHALQITPLGAEKRKGFTAYNDNSLLPIVYAQEGSLKSYLIYRDVYSSTDVVKKLSYHGIKETIILKSEQAPDQFEFILNVPDEIGVAQFRGAIEFHLKNGSGNGNLLFQIPEPFMLDAEKKYSYNCNWNLEKIDNNQYKLILNYDTRGLTYPIAIDPSLTTQSHYWWRNDDGLEAAFNTTGAVISDYTISLDKAYAIASDSEYLYIAGYCNGCGLEGSYAYVIEKRSKFTGQLDPNFGNEGVVIHDPSNDIDEAYAVTTDDSNIYVAGYCNGCGDEGTYAYNIASFVKSDGSYNTSFGGDGSVSHDPTIGTDYAYAITDDGTNLYVAGYCNGCGDVGGNAYNIASFIKSDGSYNTSFGGNGSVSHDPSSGLDYAYAITDDGTNLYVAGYCFGCGDEGNNAYNIASFVMSDGSYNTSFGGDGSVSHDPTIGADVGDSIIDDGTNLYVAGFCNGCGDEGSFAYNIASFVMSDGSYNTSFGGDGSVSHDPTIGADYAYAITDDGTNLYVAGYCFGCGDEGGFAYNIASFVMSDGSYNTSFGSGGSVSSDPTDGDDWIEGIVKDDNYLYITGFQDGGGQLDGGQTNNYAWRTEKRYISNGDLASDSATYKTTDIDTAVTDQAKEEDLRLRFQITVTEDALTNGQFELEVAPKGGYSTCEDVPTGDYSTVPTTTGGCGSSVACITTSTWFTNQASTSQQMGTWAVVSDYSNFDYASAIASDSEYIYITGACNGCGPEGNYAWLIEKRSKFTGQLDPNFGNEGVVIHDPGTGDDRARAITNDDTNVYVAGYCTGCGYNANKAWNIVSLDKSDGSYNTSFGGTGSISHDLNDSGEAYGIVDDSTNIYVTGYIIESSVNGINVASFVKSDGSYNTSFGGDGSVSHDPTNSHDYGYAIIDDGTNLYVAGYCDSCGDEGDYAYTIASFVMSDGSYNTSFGGDGSVSHDPSSGTDIPFTITDDGTNIYVAGFCNGCGDAGDRTYSVASFVKSDGSYNTSFGGDGSVSHDPSSGYDYAYAITTDDSNVYVGGYCAHCGSVANDQAWNIAAFVKSDGSYDTDFGSGGSVSSDPSSDDDNVQGMVKDDDYLYITGEQDSGGWMGDSSFHAIRTEKRDISSGRLDTWQEGQIIQDPSNITGGIDLASGSFIEVEYQLQLTANAANSTNYCFRVTNNGTPLDDYNKVAPITTAETSGFTTVKGNLRFIGNIRIK